MAVFRRSLLDKVPFDSRAGSLWFEAWARDIVLAGSEILIFPAIAADLLTSHDRRENSKHLTGGVLDQAGLMCGLNARLLAIDAVEVPGQSVDRPIHRDDNALFNARRFMPDSETRPYPLVAARPYLKGLLVHPTQDGATIAELQGHHRRLKRIEVDACNASNDNTGVEIAIALAPKGTRDDVVRRAVTGESDTGQIAMSAWRYVAPGAEERIALSVQNASLGGDRIFLMSRVPPNGDEMNCHLIFRSVDEFLNTDLL